MIFSTVANRHISATPRGASCVWRNIIIRARELLRSYPKLKVNINIAPRKIRWLLLLQIAEIGAIVDPICPFVCKSLTTSPYFIRAGASAGNLDVYIPTNIWKAEVQTSIRGTQGIVSVEYLFGRPVIASNFRLGKCHLELSLLKLINAFCFRKDKNDVFGTKKVS